MQQAAGPAKPEAAVPAKQQRQQRPALPGVIFDSDMGANIDAALALALLYGASAKVKVIGVTVTNPSLEAAAFCDVMGRFYASGGQVNSAPPHYYAPIGFAGDGKKSSVAPMLTRPLALKTPDGKILFGNSVEDVNDTADVALVFRNALTTQKDGEGIVLVAGPATNLVRAMAMPGNKELIAAKAGLLILAAGAFSGAAPDPRMKADVASARKALAEWPGEVVFVGREAGAALPYPGASVASEFLWSTTHPVVEAYKAYQPLPYDAPSQAVIAALYATAVKDDMFKLSEPGRVEIQDDGRTKFVRSASGKHRYILAETDPALKDRVTKTFTAMASAKPAAPAGRGGFRQQQNQQIQAGQPPAPAQP